MGPSKDSGSRTRHAHRFLSPLALALLAGISLQAQASSDDSCYPDWRVSRDSLEPCSNQPFLSPGNDSRVNLRLLLADKKPRR